MRIVGGKHRGRKLASFKGEQIRPTADRVKESLFNILSTRVKGAAVLDLFCGSGNLGLESLSRGAAFAHFNDISKESLAVAKSNVNATGESELSTFTNQGFDICLSGLNKKFDLIFLDPPYALDYGEKALKIIWERRLLTEGGVVIYERDRAFTGDSGGLKLVDERKYGKTHLTFFEYGGDQ